MKIVHLNHVALEVSDLERTKRFYEGVVGLQPIPRPAFSFPGVWYRLGVDQELHIIVVPEGPPVRSSSRGNHFALMVESMPDAEARLRSHNVSFNGPRTRPDGALQIFFTDPDGHTIEFCTAPLPAAS
jgi:catechol 2,3-dioxygenase-like lactoylglutathione lyase family enzyme